MSKLPNSSLTVDNNMNRESKNNKLRSRIINHHKLNSLKKSKNSTRNDLDIYDVDNEMTIYKNALSQEQSSELYNNEMHERSISQGSIEINEDVLSKNTSNFMSENESYDTSGSLNNIRTERAVNKKRKRTAEENADFNCNRKKKLNKNFRLTKPINQQCKGLTSNGKTITAQSNIVSKDEELNCKQDDDLRNQLNLKRSQRTDIQKLTLESKCNNKGSAVLLGQINVEDKNDTIMTKKQTKKIEKNPTFKETCYKKENNSQVIPDLHHNSCNNLDLLNTIQNPEEINENVNIEEQHTNSIIDNEEDDECISLSARSDLLDESRCEDLVSHKKKEPCQLPDFNKSYMSAPSFDKYAECKSNTEMPSKSNKIKELSNNQQKQTLCTNYVASDIPRTVTRVTPSTIGNIDISHNEIKQIFNGYCFDILRKGICRWKPCKYNHNYQSLMNANCLRKPRQIFKILQTGISAWNYNFFCEQMYIASLTKLSVEQILLIYAKLNDHNSKQDFTLSKNAIYNIVMELKKKMSLKTIVERLVKHMPVKNMKKIDIILECVDKYVKPGEYWNTVRILILKPNFQPIKDTVEKILKECINYEVNIQDVKNILMNKLDSALTSTLDKNLMECFENLTKKTMQNSSSLTLIQDFGKDSAQNIASPDSNTNEILLQMETPKKCDIVAATSNDTNRSYVIQPDGGLKANEITNGILFLIAKNNLPFDLVESEGFKVLMDKAAPLYKVPSRRTITKLIEERYDELSTLVKGELADVQDICLTTDVWTESNNTKSFLGFTAHYFVNEEQKSVTIGVAELKNRHTADYLKEELLNIMSQWNIKKESIVAVVSNSAANIKKVIIDAFGADKHLSCFAYTLNSVSLKIIQNDEISPIITKIKTIITFFKTSVIAADKLRHETNIKLIQSVETRWNSYYEMMKIFVELADELSMILLLMNNGPEMLTSVELKIVKEFIQLLEPFYKATQIVSEEKYFTGSKIIPVVKIIKNKLNLLTTSTESGGKRRLKKLLCEEFSKKFENIERILILVNATLLDPRFKRLHFENELACSNALKKLIITLHSLSLSLSTNENNEQTIKKDQLSQIPDSDVNFWSFHEMIVNSDKSKKSEMSEDLRYYLDQNVVEMKINPITFWNCYSPSTLSKIAKRYLTVVVPSIPSKHLFSRAGNIMIDCKNKHSTSHLQQLLFLNSLSLKEWRI